MSSHSAATRRPGPVALPSLGRTALRRLLIAAMVSALVFAGWMWLRESALVSVDRVTVSGLSDSHAKPVRAALEAAAQGMTTLAVDRGALRDAVARFPLVRDIEVTPQVPHGLRIRVIERVPVGAIETGGGAVVVAADGTILRGLPAGDLPRITSRVTPGGARVSDRRTAVKVAVLAAAPRRLRARIVRVTLGPQGLIAVLTSGPKLRFGDGSRLDAKWLAATRVLHDPVAREAAYIDLRIPERPAAGGLTVEEGGTQVQASVQGSVAPAQAGTPTTDPAAAPDPAADPAAGGGQAGSPSSTGTTPAVAETAPAVPGAASPQPAAGTVGAASG